MSLLQSVRTEIPKKQSYRNGAKGLIHPTAKDHSQLCVGDREPVTNLEWPTLPTTSTVTIAHPGFSQLDR